MPGRGSWMPGNGYVWGVLCLLLMCLPPSSPAVVFPNDVLSSLEKYKSNSYSGHEHSPKGKSASPLSSPSFSSSSSSSSSSSTSSSSSSSSSSSTDSSGSGKALFPVETALTRHFYLSVSEPSFVPGTPQLPDEFFNQELLKKDSFYPTPESVEVAKNSRGHPEYRDVTPQQQEQLMSKPSVADSTSWPKAADTAASVSEPFQPHHSLASAPDSKAKNSEPSVRETHEPLLGELGVLSGERDTQKKVDRGDPRRNVPPSTTTEDQQQQQQETHQAEEKKQCLRCRLRDGDRAYRIASIKQKILERLHLTSPPNRTGMPVPKALAHMSGIHTDLLQDAPYGGAQHQYYDEQEEDEDYTPPERVFTSAKPLPAHLQTGKQSSCYFTMPAEVYRSRVTKAYLWFYVRHAREVQSAIIQMRVNRLGPSMAKKHRPSTRVIWTHKAFPQKAFGWKRVELTNVVRRWSKHPSSNYGLEILAMNGDENLAILPPTSAEFGGYEPILDIKVTSDAKRRYRRSDSLTCSENSTEHRCCRYPLTVSFAEFGWEWVIAPTHVKADYCSGECRMTLQNKTPYSWIASQTSEGGSCCTPSKMTALPLLYFDQHGDVVFQMLQNMRVERCGCA